MTIQNECISCIAAQSRRVCEAIEADETLSTAIITYVESQLETADFTLSPPIIATPLYEEMARLANTNDLYDEQKRHASLQAKNYLPFLEETIQRSNNPFIAILKTAVVGNVIDLAAEVSFDLHEAIMSVFHTSFAHDDSEALHIALKNAKSVLYIGDNAGEHLFDGLAIRSLQQLYPHIDFSYMVRGNPIINDVTLKEAYEAEIDKICRVVDSGVPTPGFVYELSSDEAKNLFDNADLIIAKGMGNYECMTPQKRENICFLLKVKCSVVADSLDKNVGDIICKFS